MFILKKGHQPGVYVPLRALFLVVAAHIGFISHLIVSLSLEDRFTSCMTYKLPYSLYLAHSALSIFKIALKMLSKIAFQLAHSANISCLPGRAVMAVVTF